MATIQFRIDDETKAETEEIFEELGINMTTAIKMFLAQVKIEQGIPFGVKRKSKLDIAIEEIKRGEYETFDSVEAMMKEALS